jgi:transcriptional repressor NrdR
MKCPFCAHGENKVIDSRISKDGDAIRRRRECLGCGKRFTTYEFVEEVLPWLSKDMPPSTGQDPRQDQGLKNAHQHRAIEAVVDRVERACQEFRTKFLLGHRGDHA